MMSSSKTQEPLHSVSESAHCTRPGKNGCETALGHTNANLPPPVQKMALLSLLKSSPQCRQEVLRAADGILPVRETSALRATLSKTTTRPHSPEGPPCLSAKCKCQVSSSVESTALLPTLCVAMQSTWCVISYQRNRTPNVDGSDKPTLCLSLRAVSTSDISQTLRSFSIIQSKSICLLPTIHNATSGELIVNGGIYRFPSGNHLWPF